ncbi:MAG TPA: transcription termination/antitermination protein NusG, partial [Ruminococcus flavefaciens]|nr:transcription termination/antitermination protein NusG [Ruminococcus flavefaciens]
TALSDEEVQKLFGIDVSTVEVNFKVGDRVKIAGTAMDGFIGIVQNINLEDRTVDLLVSMFGRETPTALPISQVVTVED